MSFTDVEQAVDYISTIAAPFGLTRREDWRELVEPGLKRDGAAVDAALRPADRSAIQSVNAGALEHG